VVDVWEELGKAIGRALKPISDIGASVWRSLGGAMAGLVGDLLGSAGSIKTAQQPGIDALIPNVLDEATKSLGEESPPKEIKEAVDKMILQLTKKIEKESKTEAKSLPTLAELTGRQGALTAAVVTMYAATHAISIALDASQPFKDWGFKTAIMDMMYQFNMRDVVGPMIQAPIWSGVVTPLRKRWNEVYPYEIPASGTLPYLKLKGLITDAEYRQNMAFHALDEGWADKLEANALRYPDWADMRSMIHRGVKTWADARAVLKLSLLTDKDVDAYEKLLPSIPGVGDLVRFAVREAYSDAKTFEEHYAKMTGWIGQIGYGKYWADAFWTAHWIIPSPGQADELLHRGEITEVDHTALYVLNDIRPQDIPNLRKLTWRLPGRIDARWLFRWGKLDVTGLRDLLVKGGLDAKYAGDVAEAVAKNQYLADINRQVANVKADFVKGTVLEAELRADLTALGVARTFVDYHVTDALEDRTRAQKADRLSLLRARYTRGAATMATVVAEAEAIILDKDTRDLWLQALPELKQEKAVEETYAEDINRLVANVKADYVQGTILKDALVKRLQFLGLPDQVIQYQVMDADEDRARKRATERLDVIKDMWLKDVESDISVVEGWAKEIIVDADALENWVSDIYFQKLKAVKI
jgi:hypothetical protein